MKAPSIVAASFELDVDGRLLEACGAAATLFGLGAGEVPLDGLVRIGQVLGTHASESIGKSLRDRTAIRVEISHEGRTYSVATHPTSERLAVQIAEVTAWVEASDMQRVNADKSFDLERAQWTNAISQQQRLFETTLGQLPVGIVVCELPDGRVGYTNAAMSRLFRTPGDSRPVLGPFGTFEAWTPSGAPVAPDDQPLARVLLRGESSPGEELCFRRADSSQGRGRVRASPIVDELGVTIAAVAIWEEISEEVAMRVDVERNERFRQLFLAMLGHDLRNPLSSVVSTAVLLLKRGGLELPQIRLVDRILVASQRMSRMIDQILDFTRSRVGAGIPVEIQAVEMDRLVQKLVDESEASSPEVHIDFEPGASCLVGADPDRLAQVVSNLLGNAIQHGSSGIPIRVRTGIEGPAAFLTVHNMGPAIPPALVPVLFDPFHQGNRVKGKKSEGLGLGLHIAYQIVRSHGGVLDVQSTEEHGTTFTVRLPLHGAQDRSDPSTGAST